ncbi:uncharacterized protein [Nicotiana sylvestris]|uniref:uncharacterized protein n=1 Tax=Nicotiana sylvestris TaxID=4096 RepID=UPI00388CCDF3
MLLLIWIRRALLPKRKATKESSEEEEEGTSLITRPRVRRRIIIDDEIENTPARTTTTEPVLIQSDEDAEPRDNNESIQHLFDSVSTAPISVPLAISTAPASAPVLVSTSFPSIPSTAPLPSVHHTETASEGETSMTQSVEVEASVTLASLIDPNISSSTETVPIAASSEVATVPVAESEINIATSDKDMRDPKVRL